MLGYESWVGAHYMSTSVNQTRDKSRAIDPEAPRPGLRLKDQNWSLAAEVIGRVLVGLSDLNTRPAH